MRFDPVSYAMGAKSGGGGGSTGNLFVVTFTVTEEDDELVATADKTYFEIMDAHRGGNVVVFSAEGMMAFPVFGGPSGIECTFTMGIIGEAGGTLSVSTLTYLPNDEILLDYAGATLTK